MLKRLRALLLLCAGLATALPSVAVAQSADLMVGDPSGRNVTFTFERDANRKPVSLTITTMRLGNPGAKLSIWIDRNPAALLSHILTEQDCRYSDAGSACRLSIDGASDRYREFLLSFERGLTAHVEVRNANVMEMREDVSLVGFRKNYRP